MPLPYFIEKGVDELVKELDWEGLKVSIPLQLAAHVESAIQRSLEGVMLLLFHIFRWNGYNTTYDDPVSRMTLYETAGVPMATVP